MLPIIASGMLAAALVSVAADAEATFGGPTEDQVNLEIAVSVLQTEQW